MNKSQAYCFNFFEKDRVEFFKEFGLMLTDKVQKFKAAKKAYGYLKNVAKFFVDRLNNPEEIEHLKKVFNIIEQVAVDNLNKQEVNDLRGFLDQARTENYYNLTLICFSKGDFVNSLAFREKCLELSEVYLEEDKMKRFQTELLEIVKKNLYNANWADNFSLQVIYNLLEKQQLSAGEEISALKARIRNLEDENNILKELLGKFEGAEGAVPVGEMVNFFSSIIDDSNTKLRNAVDHLDNTLDRIDEREIKR